MASLAARCRASASNWMKWWRVSWVAPWTVALSLRRLDGLTQKVREGGRIVNVVVATGVNAEGQREILGMDVGTSEDGAFWLAFLRSLTARGLSGVDLVTSDAHQVSRVNYICRLESISFAGSPPRPGPVVGQRRSGSWGRQTPG